MILTPRTFFHEWGLQSLTFVCDILCPFPLLNQSLPSYYSHIRETAPAPGLTLVEPHSTDTFAYSEISLCTIPSYFLPDTFKCFSCYSCLLLWIFHQSLLPSSVERFLTRRCGLLFPLCPDLLLLPCCRTPVGLWCRISHNWSSAGCPVWSHSFLGVPQLFW